MTLLLSLVLLGLGVVTRLIPHAPNYLIIGPAALALYAGARLPKRWAWAVPLLALLVSDVILTWNTTFRSSLWSFDNFTRYATLAIIVLAAARVRHMHNPLGWVGLAIAGSILFFITTNFAVWAAPFGALGIAPIYPRNLHGLIACYSAALPFFKNSLVSDVVGTVILFAADALIPRLVRTRGQSGLAPEPLHVRDR